MLNKITTEWIPYNHGWSEMRFVGPEFIAEMIIKSDGKKISYLHGKLFEILSQLVGAHFEIRPRNPYKRERL